MGKKAGNSWEAAGEESSACNTPAAAIGGVATASEIGPGDNVRNDTRFVSMDMLATLDHV